MAPGLNRIRQEGKRGMDMHRGIITVTMNPSIDVTLWLDGMHTDEANHILSESREVGGKGINVSRVIRSFGLDNLCLAVAGRDNMAEFSRFLEEEALRYELLQVDGVVRENLTLRCDGQTVKLNRRGLSMSTMLVGALMALIRSRMHPGDIVVFGGSLPENITVQDYAELILAVKNAGALVAVDSDLLTLAHYRRIAPWLIKPNIHELRHMIEVKGTDIADVVEAAKALSEAGVENALVSLGGEGLVCVSRTPDGAPEIIRAVVPQVEVKSTVGAGDSALAGFIIGYVRGQSRLECSRLAAACGTASAMLEGTDLADRETVASLLDRIEVMQMA